MLRKVVAGPVLVRPEPDGTWAYAGIDRFDGLLHGGVRAGEVVTVHRVPRSALAPIAGGSDAPESGLPVVRVTDMAPKSPSFGAPRRSRDAPRHVTGFLPHTQPPSTT